MRLQILRCLVWTDFVNAAWYAHMQVRNMCGYLESNDNQ